MKKNFLFSLMAILMLSLTFVSCGDDDEEDNGSTDLKEIVGVWKFQSWVVTLDGEKAEDLSGSATDTDFTTYEFKSDGSGIRTVRVGSGVSSSNNFTWSVKGKKLILVYLAVLDGKDVTTEHTYSFDGDALILVTEVSDDGHVGKEVDTLVKYDGTPSQESDEEETGNTELQEILGVWKCQSAILYENDNPVEGESFIADENEYMTYEFKSDGEAVFIEYRNGVPFSQYIHKWSVSDNKLTFTYIDENDGKEANSTCTFYIKDNTLVMTSEITEEGLVSKEVDTYIKQQ